jgi:hypothetical protein
MAKEVTFTLNTKSASSVLTDLAMPTIKRATNAIAGRANNIASSMSGGPPGFTVKAQVGVIRRGQRAIGTISAPINNSRQSYIAHTALAKSRDAGRV